MDRNQVKKYFDEIKAIVAIRHDNLEIAIETIRACLSGGLTVFEISLSLRCASDIFKTLAPLRDKGCFGGGEIFDRTEAKKAQAFSADFLVSPLCSDEVMEFGKIHDLSVVLSGFTPTEIIKGWRLGADAVSVYPVEFAGGKEYIKTILSSYPKVRLIAYGGIDLNNMINYFSSGASMVMLDEIFQPDPKLLAENKLPDFRLMQRRAQTIKNNISSFMTGGAVGVQRGI
jgi:2-dehydro-3-deoxyphosphogluconate aldolase / (4S)-4-hydroxy-2-oxoglutarate aldolase